MAKKRGWLWRIVVGLAWALGGLLVLCVLVVLVFRFAPVPVSGLMVQRRIESWSGPKPYASRHHWVPLE